MTQPAYFGIAGNDHAKGVEIETIEPNSPAAVAGLKVGDIIARFANTPTKSRADLSEIVRATAAGTVTRVNLFRGGEKVTIEVTLSSAPATMKKKKLSLDVGDVSEVLERKISP